MTAGSACLALALAAAGGQASAVPSVSHAGTSRAGTSATTAGGTWDAPLAVSSGWLLSVSCAAPGDCAAGGHDRSANGRAIVVSEQNATWGRPRDAAAGLDVEGSSILSVSCGSAGDCAAGGLYTDKSGGIQAFVITETDGAWGEPHEIAAALNNGGDAEITAVSCPDAGDCTAGGSYTRGGVPFPFAVSETQGSWGPAKQLGGTGPDAGVTSVSCASPGNCTAGGTAGDEAFVVTETAGSWGAEQPVTATPDELAAEITTVSCGSAGDCAAGGNYTDAAGDLQAFVASGKNGTWTGSPVTGLKAGTDVPPATVNSVSCAAPGNCTAGGVAGSGQAFVVSEAKDTWGTATPISVPPAGAAEIRSVSCTEPGECGAGGTSGSNQGFVVSEVGGHWGSAHVIGQGSNVISSVSCASPGDCAAGGIDAAVQAIAVDEVNPVVGIYSDFTTPADVTKALGFGWPLVANIGGRGAPKGVRNCVAPWTIPVPVKAKADSDDAVQQVLSKRASPRPGWISYWTPVIPPVEKDNDAALQAEGEAAGKAAASDLEKSATGAADPASPAYVALDFETSAPRAPSAKSCGNAVTAPELKKKPKPGDKQCWDWADPSRPDCFGVDAKGWREFSLGWAAGVRSAGPLRLVPAIYANKTEYGRFALGGVGLPVILAVSPISAKKPPKGPNVVGYAAFYGGCDAKTADADLADVRSWGGLYDSIQFRAGKTVSVLCRP